jgi:hypothetical protein
MLMPFFFVNRSPRTRPPNDLRGIKRKPSKTRKSRGSSKEEVVLGMRRLLKPRSYLAGAAITKAFIRSIRCLQTAFAVLHNALFIWAMVEAKSVTKLMQHVFA